MNLLKRTNNKCVFVDLDFTLVNVNTTFDFLHFFFYRRYGILSRLFYPLAILNRVVGSDVYKQSLLFFCAGKTVKVELERYSMVYVRYLLTHRNQYFNMHLLDQLKNVEHTKILLTASIDLIADNLKELGFDLIISSKTCYRNNRFIGVNDLYHKKHQLVRMFTGYFDEMLIIEDTPEPEYVNIKGVKVKEVSFK